MNNNSLTLINSKVSSFSEYLSYISKIKLLTEEEEKVLIDQWYIHHKQESAHKLIMHHLPLVLKVSYKYKNYNLPMEDIISEGNVGLIRALSSFDPNKGYRFSTYAMWWIKAYVSEFVIKAISMVKVGTLAAKKKVFYSLSQTKKSMGIEGALLEQSDITKLADHYKVSKQDIIDINYLLTHSTLYLENLSNNDDEDESSWQERYHIEDHTPEDEYIEDSTRQHNTKVVQEALNKLSERDKSIVERRLLHNEKITDIATSTGLSRETIRKVINKSQKIIKESLLQDNIYILEE